MDEHVALAKANLARAKAQYKAAQALYQNALQLQKETRRDSSQGETDAVLVNSTDESSNAIGQLLLEQTTTATDVSQSDLTFCEECNALPLIAYFNPDDPKWPRHKRVAVGELTEIRKKAKACPLCYFLVDALSLIQELNLPSENAIGANAALRDQIKLVEGKPLWTEVAGCDLNIDPTAFAWLELDSLPRVEVEKQAPYVCITWHPNSINESAPRKIFGPRLHSVDEQSKGLVNYDLVNSWLHTCAARHRPPCAVVESISEAPISAIPVYLIDIHTRDIVQAQPCTKYVAVSYVWGVDHPSPNNDGLNLRERNRELASNIADDGTRQLPSVLPRTLEDALTLATAIGEQFVWIDKYCINQDDEKEVKDQIANMNNIYRNAWLTIVALASPDANSGIAGISRPFKSRKQPTLALPQGSFIATYIEHAREHYGLFPWDARAWTLQEFVLSRRCLMFTDFHVSMLCLEEFFHDTVPLSTSGDPNVSSIPIESKLDDEYWWDNVFGVDLNGIEWDFKAFDGLITIFSGQLIRYQSEILNACRGCFNHITQMTGMAFVFGLPVGDMNRGLLWKANNETCLVPRTWYDEKTQVFKSFPSWTWAGWQGATEYDYWVGDMAGYAHYESTDSINILNRKRRKRPRREEDSLNDDAGLRKARILRSSRNDDVSHPHLQLFSLIARCEVECIRRHGDKYNVLRKGAKTEATAIGDHWTLLEANTTNKRRDIAGNDTRFESRDYFFRTDGSVSDKIQQASRIIELLMINHWPPYPLFRSLRSLATGYAWRIAAILLEEEVWNQYDPVPIEVDLV